MPNIFSWFLVTGEIHGLWLIPMTQRPTPETHCHLGVVRHLRCQGVLNLLQEPFAVVLILGLGRLLSRIGGVGDEWYLYWSMDSKPIVVVDDLDNQFWRKFQR